MIKLIFFLVIFGSQLDAFALRATRYTCSNLEKYKELLREKDKNYLEKHPNCNAAAIKAGMKDKEFWMSNIEGAYKKHFGYPSAVFLDGICDKNKDTATPCHTRNYFEEEFEKKDYILILSLDGGGVRGIIPAMILDHIQKEVTRKLNKKVEEENEKEVEITDIFDIFVGTSTGGLIALYLNVPDAKPTDKYPQRPHYSTTDLVELYKELPGKIFSHPNIIRKIRSTGGLLTSKYTAKSYESFLKQKFRDFTLAQTIKPVIITSFDLSGDAVEPFHFETLDAIKKPAENYFLWQAARATSAAPSFFKPFVLGKHQLVDGGVGVNTPVSLGLNTIKELCPHEQTSENIEKWCRRKKVIVVSLGTGYSPYSSKFKGTGAFGGGLLSGGGKNLNRIVDALMTASNSNTLRTIEKELKSVGGYYLIINPKIKGRDIMLDSTSKTDMELLQKVAKTTIKEDTDLQKLIKVITLIYDESILTENKEKALKELFEDQPQKASACTQFDCSNCSKGQCRTQQDKK